MDLLFNDRRIEDEKGLAFERIKLEARRIEVNSELEKMRIEKLASLDSRTLDTSLGGQVGKKVDFQLLKEELIASIPTAKKTTSQSLIEAISSVAQKFVEAGKITVKEASDLKKRLVDAGIDITKEGAKAIIDRFIREKESESSEALKTSFSSGVTYNNYISMCPAVPKQIKTPTSRPKPLCVIPKSGEQLNDKTTN